MAIPPVRTFSVLASYKALRVDIAGLRGALRRLWDGRRVFDVKLERDWAIVSFTTRSDVGASIDPPSSTAPFMSVRPSAGFNPLGSSPSAAAASSPSPSSSTRTPFAARSTTPTDVDVTSAAPLPNRTPAVFGTDTDTDTASDSAPLPPPPAAAGGFSPIDVHVGVSRRGSVVVYNNSADQNPAFQVEGVLHDANLSTPLPDGGLAATEDLTVRVDPGAEKWSTFVNGHLVLKRLDYDSIRILNSCMAQTVNLQYFESQVDAMYETVVEINTRLETTDQFGIDSGSLHKHLAATNSITNAIMLSGLKNITRPGSTAWKMERYSELQELLWEEFDLEERYVEIERKLNYVNDVIRYSIEVAKDNKSLMLERAIVLLITVELALSAFSAGLPRKIAELLAPYVTPW